MVRVDARKAGKVTAAAKMSTNVRAVLAWNIPSARMSMAVTCVHVQLASDRLETVVAEVSW